jgi:hypothetical protein
MTVAETLVAGRYRIGPCLGTGGMGRVWLARDEVLRRDVAIKEIALPFGLTDDEREELRARTLREARAAARLNHPNVVRTYDVQPGDERPWIVMEYVPSRSLLQVIKENGPLPPTEVAGIGLAVLSALDAAQRAGVSHRDIKPSNVLIADDGRVMLTDFGSAMIDEGEGALTQTGIILGSPFYIAPERAAKGISTLESDLWSLGATLYEAVEGRPPYKRDTTMSTLVALATEKPDPLERAGVLKPVINGLLQKNPRNRLRLPEAEERLRRIADVQSAVTLLHVPAPRARAQVPSPTPAKQVLTPDDIIMRYDTPAPALPAVDGGPPTRPASAAPAPAAAPSRAAQWRERGQWRSRPVMAGAAAVVVLAGGAVWAVEGGFPAWSSGAHRPNANAVIADQPSAPAVVSASATAATPRTTVLPAGYKWYNSKSGFHLAWPSKWGKIQESRTSVTLCAPGGPPLVAVREWQPSDPDLRAALRREETAAALGNYKRLKMTVTPEQDSAEWEYTFTDPKMGDLHGVDNVVVQGGRAYIIQWRTPAAKWIPNQSRLRVILDTFRTAAPRSIASLTRTPSGFVAYRSPSGFQMVAPAKWGKIAESRTSVVFCAPGGPPLVGVRAWTPSDANLSAALAHEEQVAKLPHYRRISLEQLPDAQGAIWEYTFTDPKMGRLHGLERAFMTSKGAYLVQWRTPIDKWADNLPTLGAITTTFRTTA